MDHGSDRKAYIEAFLKQLNWAVADANFAALTL